MFADIRNFITIRWDKQEMESPPPWLKVAKKPLDKHIEIHEKLFWQLAKQIRVIYPKSTLHVIKNKSIPNKNGIVFHALSVPSSHMAKLEMYGLIEEPAMYIDTDVLLISKFTKQHIDVCGPFNYYSLNNSFNDVQLHAKKKLPIQMRFMYNAGMVWISKPSKKSVEDMKCLHEEYFNSLEVEEKIGFQIGDEHCASLYSLMNRIEMNLYPEINVLRRNVQEFEKCQSVHYTGYMLENKQKCIDEFDKSLAFRCGVL